MDNIERRQDERHKENVEALKAIQTELVPLTVQMRQICGDENYPGRMGLAEKDIQELNKVVKAINMTLNKWAGIIVRDGFCD